MSFHKGPDRKQTQLLPPSLEEYVAANAPVRFIDAFVDGLDLKQLGFKRAEPGWTGRRPYDPADLLKLYVYGYLQRIRSSRRLEAESGRNLELMWLLRAVSPDFKTIADFRKDNRACFKGVLKQFNLLCRKLDLFGAELVAIDGSKFKALNHPKRHCTTQELAQMLKQVEERIDHYLTQLDQGDAQAEGVAADPGRAELEQKLRALREHQGQYEQWIKNLGESQQEQMGLTDPDSRGQKSVGMGYNVQVAVDAKHDLIVAAEVVQDANDLGQLKPMAQAARQELGVPRLKVVADAGYHAAAQLAACETEGIETYLPAPQHRSGQSKDGQAIYPKEAFEYESAQDRYRCPAGQSLTRSYEHKEASRTRICYENPKACRTCLQRAGCTQGEHRRIYRAPDEPAVERASQRVRTHPEIVAERKTIVEHVFGTLRNWGQDEFITRGLTAVRAEFSLSSLAYNLRRVLRLVSWEKFLEAAARMA